MTTSTQQMPSNPALDFANAILEETNGGLEIIDMLHDIAQGVRQNSTPVTASTRPESYSTED